MERAEEMISLLFFVLAAICNACMDTYSHHYFQSIFKHYLNPSGFNFFWAHPDLTWKNKYIDRDPKKGLIKWCWGLIDKPVFLTDAWHLFKSLMIFFICLSISSWFWIVPNDYNYGLIWPGDAWHFPVMIVIVFGTVWNLIFNLFYNHILIKKK